MKKKIFVVLSAIIACVAFIFAFGGCSTDGNDETEKNNYAETVLVPYDEGPSIGMVYTFVSRNGEYVIDCNDKSYTIADLTGQSMPYNNYATFTFSWKTSNYKIKKVEFDISAQDTLNTTIYVFDDYSQNVNLTAGKSIHVAIDCDVSYSSYPLVINNNKGTNGYFNGSYCTARWKLSNLFITAEKV